MNGITVNAPFNFGVELLKSILVTAFEGGIGYWAKLDGYENLPAKPPAFAQDTHSEDFTYPRYAWLPLTEKGGVRLADREDGKVCDKPLNLKTLTAGLTQLAAERLAVFSRFVNENYDADDADMLVQYALFGRVVYG